MFYQDGVACGAQRITGLPGSAAGVNLGVEAIREFRVLTPYSPEYGKKAGGAIITVTKSGTNELHGSVFEFHRNEALDAPNFFAVAEKDPFKRNNFGASLGGPIVKSRTFFFGNYEGLRERLASPQSVIVPNADARRGFLPNAAGVLEFVGVAPVVAPFLDLWPLPNGRDFGDGTAAYEFAPSCAKLVRTIFWGRSTTISLRTTLSLRATAFQMRSYRIRWIIHVTSKKPARASNGSERSTSGSSRRPCSTPSASAGTGHTMMLKVVPLRTSRSWRSRPAQGSRVFLSRGWPMVVREHRAVRSG